MKKTLLSFACLLGTFISNAQTGAALHFDGVNDYVMTGSNITHGNQFTYEAWVNPMSANQWGGIVTTSSTGGQSQWVQITLNSVGALRAEIVDDFGNNKWYEGTTSLLGTWHHIAVSFDGTNLLFYVDGNKETISVISNSTLGTMTINSQLNIGAERNQNVFYNGDIDEVRVWNVARTQCEIISYMNCEIPTAAAGLVANYHFNQGVPSGVNTTVTSLTDASGNGNNGTLSNFALTGSSSNWVSPGGVVSGFTTSIACPLASGLRFDGSNDMVSIPGTVNATDLGLSAFTLEAWVYLNSSSGAQSIVRKSGDYNFYVYNGNLGAEVWPLGTSNSSWNFISGNTGPAMNQWTHVAFTWNGTTGTLYVNGSQIPSTTTNGNISASENLHLGASSVYGDYLNGSLDEVRIWNTSRTNCELISFMNCEIPTTATGLVANYHFNQGIASYSNLAETILMDASGNSYNGTLNNFALSGTTSNWVAPGAVVSGYTTTSNCPVAAALNFDGSSNRVDLGTSINNILDPLNTITVEAWVNPATTTGLGCIIGNYNTNNGNSMQLLLRRDFDNYAFWVDCGSGFQVVNSGPATVLVGTWQHVAGVWDGSELRIYIDGVLKSTQSNVNGSSFVSNSGSMMIGYNSINERFNGSIDELRVWTSARTACEINSYKMCEIPTTSAGLLANYHFNQGLASYANPTETSLTDASGNAHNGTLYSFNLSGTNSNWVAPGAIASGYSTPAVCAEGLNFDGANDVVSLPNGLPSMAEMTIEGWIYPESISNFNVILNNSNWYTGLLHFQLRPSGELGFSINGNNPADQNTSMVFTPNQWYHIAAVYSSTNQYLKLYVNGILVDTYAYTTAIATAANAQFEIGGWDGQRFFDGTMDELRIWNTTRTECEINTYMNCEIPSSATGLVVNYHFNQGLAASPNPTQTGLTDASGNGNNGTLNSFALSGTSSNWIAPGAVVYGYTTTLAPPVISVTSGSICAGQSFTMIPSGASTYTFSNGTDVVMPASDATYSVSGTSSVGCVSIVDAVASITVNALPTVSVTSGAICAGQSFTIVPTGAVTYTYSNGTDVVMPTADATYSVSGTDANGCVSSIDAVSSVTVNALPTISVNSGVICSGQSFTMVPTGATTYTYSNGTDVVMPTADATYSVSGTDANGCVSSVDAVSSVTVNALPTLVASTTNTLLCTGETATLSVTGATSYTWSTTETASDIAVTPTTQTTYTVEGTDGNGCSNTTTVTQDVSLCTGIVNLLSNNELIKVYPNPNNGLFIVDLTTLSQVTVTNALGQAIISETMEAGKHNLTIQGQSTGIYFVKITQNNKQQVIKIIKE
ncbi:MAG: LamG-like jellyroll fold domain-containing protein [Bacteroidota bacterium]